MTNFSNDFVNLEQVKQVLNYDHDLQDEVLTMFIGAATESIRQHIDATAFDLANKQQQQAALLLIGYWDRNRNAENDEGGWYLPSAVRIALVPYRTPTAV